jgi:hypothetical protein
MITKQQLGIAFILIGLLIVLGTLTIDLIGAGDFQGIGPFQKVIIAGGSITSLVGLTLLPFGNRPA